ncbi:hypothetical protein [Maricaulis parjimensis]|uniref:hypothetical protein n=1 Tax=Maricaulis parjimensis TaxID=144023 RepID=UPI00193AD6B7|nr:hypothetical protein [Maricaulis parjimensis]
MKRGCLAVLAGLFLAACSTVQTDRPLPAYIGMSRAQLEAELGNTARQSVDDQGRTILTYTIDLGEPAEQRAALPLAPSYCTQGTPSRGEYDRRHYDRCSRPEPNPVRPNPSAFICPVSFTLDGESVADVHVDGPGCSRNSDRDGVRGLFRRVRHDRRHDAATG